jgi:hypothetical protein
MKYDGELEGREYRPRAARVSADYDAWVKRADGDVPVQILNVSSEGFRLRSTSPLEVGAEVLVAMAKRYPVRAIIRWTAGDEAGGQFVDPVAL